MCVWCSGCRCTAADAAAKVLVLSERSAQGPATQFEDNMPVT
jgi:hypothetical protein